MSTYRLPDGKITRSIDRYCRAWRKLAKPISKSTNSRCYGYDPGLSFITCDKPSYTWRLGTYEAVLLSEALVKGIIK